MINIIKKHLERYPDMQVKDVAKLLYQSEFGGGHMIPNPEISLKRIQEEYLSLDEEIRSSDHVVEPIGDGMCRIYLSCLSNGLRPEVLNQMFVISANQKKGTIEGLKKKIKDCLSACAEGTLPFSVSEAFAYFEEWELAGYPATSHSDVYRKAYKPAYRVVEESLAHVYEVIQEIDAGLSSVAFSNPFVVAIDGMSGSGKSTLGNLLHLNYPESNLFHMDDYFLQPHQRTPERLSEIGGNVDYERFKEEIIDYLSDRSGLTYQVYDCGSQQLDSKVSVNWQPLVIVEGVYSQHPYFGHYYHFGIFNKIPATLQKTRILERNGEAMWKRFQEEWIPKENAYFDKLRT